MTEHSYAADLATAIEDGVPENLAPALVKWIQQHRRPGDFLTAVLKNDLREAVGRAADMSIVLALPAIVTFLYMRAPGKCWGSKADIEYWEKQTPNARTSRLM
jgi:hypothetical protein